MYLPLSTLILCLTVEISARALECPAAASKKAIYMIANAKENAVIALPIAANGMLSMGSTNPTGGAGSNSIDSSTNGSAAPDALVSQSAITVAGSNLFAVNAGSNTLSMFAIDKTDPTKLTMVGTPISVPGEFPNTVGASAKNKLVCVGSTGAIAGISCSTFSEQGMTAMDSLRPIDLQQTTPPLGPTNTISQVFFSGDQRTLFATVKGDPPKNNTGFLASYSVQGAGNGSSVSSCGSESSPDGTAVLFGAANVPNSKDLFVTDASFGAAVLSVNPRSGAASVKGKGVIADQKATCWVAISPATNTAFVSDVANNRLVEMSLTDASIQGTVDLSANGDPGLIDMAAVGDFLYALSPGNGTTQPAVTVVNAISKKQVQHFDLGVMGVDKNAQGMAASL